MNKINYVMQIILILLLIFNISIYASENVSIANVERFNSLTLSNTQMRHIESRYTHQNYCIYVGIPANYYQNPTKKYSAIFLLDADYSFPITKVIAEHLADRKKIPNVFIFGIAYDGRQRYKLNRTRDYTPRFVVTGGYGAKYQKVSGGAPKFYMFLKKELMPFLSESYRLNNKKTLVGHSYGGLFASWLMLKDPTVFKNYIIVSPSLWYDNHFMFDFERKHARQILDFPLKIFFGVGSKENGGDYRMVDDMIKFTSKLHGRKLKVKSTVFPYEDHDTIFPTALTQGLLYVCEEGCS